MQVAAEVVVDALHLGSPLGVAGVRLALVHEDALDDTLFLGFAGQGDQPLVRIVVVGLEHALHPAGGLGLDIAGYLILHETLDLDTADGYMDDTYLNMLGQRGHERAAEPVGWCQTGIGTAERRHSLAPLAHLTTSLRVVDG